VYSLINGGADVNRLSTIGHSALSIAINSGAGTFVELLIKANADVNQIHKTVVAQFGYNDGMTPLYFAVSMGELDIVKMLIPHGADVKFKTFYGTTAVYVAAEKGYVECLELLIRHGADFNSGTFY